MSGREKKLRRLMDLSVHEVSLVDSPANQKTFAKIIKRKEDDEEDEREEDEAEEEGDGELTEKFETLCLEAAEKLEEVRGELEKRTLKARTADGRTASDPVSFGDVLKADEFDSVASLLESVEKVFGAYPYPYPFRRSPYPGTDKPGMPFDPSKLKAALTAAMQLEGIPAEVKAAMEAVMAAMKESVGKSEDFVSKEEFDKFAVTVTETIEAVAGQSKK
jgi:hypothetical protein